MSEHTTGRRGGTAAILACAVSFLSLLGLLVAPTAQAATDKSALAGEINIIASHSGRCVEVAGSALPAGALIVQADCTGQAGAVWRLTESAAGGGTVNVVNANSDRCMEAQSGAVGAPVRQADCSGAASVSFRVVDRSAHVWLQPLSSQPPKCLEIAAGSHTNGASVRLAECSGQSGIGFHQRAPRAGNDPATANPGGVERTSLTSAGGQNAGGIGASADTSDISANGRYVAFEAQADTLVPGDSNNASDVFVRDRVTGATELISLSSTDAHGDKASANPSISADGRYVAFTSEATNLTNGDTNNATDVFVRDRQSGFTELMSRSDAGHLGSGISEWPSISEDGRHVVFTSRASNLVAGDTNNTHDVFLRDRMGGTIERVSVTAGGVQGNSLSSYSAISGDGRHVVFASLATNLTPGDGGQVGIFDVFVRNLQTGAVERVSVSTTATEGNGNSFLPAISDDGRHIAFQSRATNLVAGDDVDGTADIFVRDRQAGTTERISKSFNGSAILVDSTDPSISGDGAHVAFTSAATNLVPYDTNTSDDVFVRDRQAGTTVRASVNDSGVQGNNHSKHAKISADGLFITFASDAANLVTGDTNSARDQFIRPRPRL